MRKKEGSAWTVLMLILSGVVASCNGKGSSGSSAVPSAPPVSSVQVAAISPSDGAVQIPLETSVTVQFSGEVDPSTVLPHTFALYVGLGAVNQVAGSVSSDGKSAVFVPAQPLQSLTAYRAVVTKDVKDSSGANLSAEYSWTFWTKDIVSPFVVSKFPIPQQKFLPLDTTIQASFSEPIVEGSVNPGSFLLKDSLGTVLPAAVTVKNGIAFLDPDSLFAEDAEYTVSITNAVVDVQGNPLQPASWTFRSTEFTPPAILSTFPASDEVDVPFDGTILQVQFSEEIDSLTVKADSILLSGPAGLVPGVVSVSGSVVSFDPTPIFESQAEYTATLQPGIADLAGNLIAGGYSWKFISQIKVLGNPGPVAGGVGGATPIVAMNESGNAAMILTKVQGGLKDVFGLTFSPGAGWSGAIALEGHANNAQGLNLALADNGNAFAVWTQLKGGGKFQGRSNDFTEGGNPPPESILLGIESTVDPTPRVGVDQNGKAIVIWKDKVSGSKANLQWAWTVAPTAWTAPALLETDDTGDVKALDLYVAPDGKACAVWGQDVGGKQNIYSARFDGTSWTTPPDLLESNDDDIAKAPIVRGDGSGNYVAIWLQKIDADGNGTINNKDKFSLYASRFTAGPTGSWDATPTLLESDDTQDVEDHVLAMDTLGNAHAAWIQSTFTEPTIQSIYSAHFDVTVGAWSPPLLVENKTESVDLPQLICPKPNQVTIAFLQFDDIFTQSPNSANLVLPGLIWSEPVPLEAEPTGSAADPSLASDGKGKSLAAWSMTGNTWANFFP